MKLWSRLNTWQQAAMVAAAISGGSIGAYAKWVSVDDRITKNTTDVIEVAGNFKQFKTEYRLTGLRRRLWRLEDRYGGRGCPKAPRAVRGECRDLEASILTMLSKKVR